MGTIDFKAWFADMDVPPLSSFYFMSQQLPPTKDIERIHGLIGGKFSEEGAMMYTNQVNDLNLFILPSQKLDFAVRKSEIEGLGIRPVLGKGASKEVYSNGWAHGEIIIVESQEQVDKMVLSGEINKDSIVATKVALRSLPLVAGVISEEPLTSGSHLSLLAQMYSIPVAYLQDATSRLKEKENQKVFLSTNRADPKDLQFAFNLSEDQTNYLKDQNEKPSFLRVISDLHPKKITPTQELTLQNVSSYGGKAVKMGYLQRVLPDKSPEKAFGIPISLYNRFLNQAILNDGTRLKEFITGRMSLIEQDSSVENIAKFTAEIRAAFKSAYIDATFFEDIKSNLAEFFEDGRGGPVRVKLRSSSNVEDGPIFNGAGLYESKGVCVKNCLKENFEKDIRRVWGSLYTERGVTARLNFKVNENEVGMGILVNRPYKGELNNGVASLILNENGDWVVEVVTEIGEDASVTNVETEGRAEVLRINANDSILRLQKPHHLLGPGRTVMNEGFYLELLENMISLQSDWPDQLKENLVSIEAEFKVIKGSIGNKKIEIKQVRQIPEQIGKLAKPGTPLFVTSKKLRFRTNIMNTVDVYGVDQLLSPESVEIELPFFTAEDLQKGDINIKKLSAQFIDKSIEFRPIQTIVNFDEKANVAEVIVLFRSKNDNLEFNLVWNNEQMVLTPYADSWITSFEISSRSNKEDTISGELIPPFKTEELYQTLNITSSPIKISGTVDGKNISILALEGEKFGYGDSEMTQMRHIEIKGILDRPIVLSDSSSHKFLHRIHEGLWVFQIDLFSDTSLSDSEKKLMSSSFGRYIYIDLSPDYNAPEGLIYQNFPDSNFFFFSQDFKPTLGDHLTEDDYG